MYPRAGLGIMAPPCDQFGNAGLTPEDSAYRPNLVWDENAGCWVDTSIMYMTPQVIVYNDPAPPPVLIQPVTVDPTTIPQQLPTLNVVAHPAQAGLGGNIGLLVLLGLGVWAFKRGGGKTGSW